MDLMHPKPRSFGSPQSNAFFLFSLAVKSRAKTFPVEVYNKISSGQVAKRKKSSTSLITLIYTASIVGDLEEKQ